MEHQETITYRLCKRNPRYHAYFGDIFFGDFRQEFGHGSHAGAKWLVGSNPKPKRLIQWLDLLNIVSYRNRIFTPELFIALLH